MMQCLPGTCEVLSSILGTKKIKKLIEDIVTTGKHSPPSLFCLSEKCGGYDKLATMVLERI